jgi:hypothetical protein
MDAVQKHSMFIDSLDIIVRNAIRLRRPTEGILDVQKIESHTLQLNIESLDLNALISDTKSSGGPINVATFLSPTGNTYPTAAVAIYMDRLRNSTTNLNNHAHFIAFPDYKNRHSDFHAYKLLELNTNSSILAGRSAYTLIGTYELHSSGLQKLMEVGTIIGDKAYSVQYIADAPRFTDYLPTVQKMIDSLQIKITT